jgi:hypothetical protein
MTNQESSRDRVSYLKGLALSSLGSYQGGFGGLEAVVTDIKSIVRSLQEVADPAWAAKILKQWGQLEILFALVLDDGRSSLTAREEEEATDIVHALMKEFRD